MTAGGEPGTGSNLVPDHIEWKKSSSGEARRRIGGSFWESKASWDSWDLDGEGKRWAFEVVVEMEEMDEVGEGGRGNSYEEREIEPETDRNPFERLR